MNLFFLLISVILISFSGILTPGPMFAITIAKGYKNRNAGAVIALGHGIIEVPLMILIYLGFLKYFNTDIIRISIGITGGLLLIYMGLEIYRAKIDISFEDRKLSYNILIAGILTTITNPYFFIWWITIGTTLILNFGRYGIPGFILFIICHWLCDLLWYWFVSIVTFKSKSFLNNKTLKIIFRICSIILIIYGLWFIVSVFMR
jgi:threonine/homoserine/homoserine lactone efflux protein